MKMTSDLEMIVVQKLDIPGLNYVSSPQAVFFDIEP
jgi:hypothetical protein